ncbi:TetR/AcrR family transcriptional regulator [Rhodococcus sp. NPDC057014]|uniref:TetR/AcrR family transcriptional regulator n=1 Tax=Rhodococcus sp. NPDC057014 TaxID=3346000 RepID=UPI00363FDBA2
MTLRDGPRSKRGLILTAAIERFGEVGFEHTKWASVADVVGIGQPALYHYFESKAHCLLTIMRLELAESLVRYSTAIDGIDDPVEALGAAVTSALEASPRDALQRRILQSHMDLLAAPRHSKKEEAERQTSRALVNTVEEAWSLLIAKGMGRGVFADADPRLMARLVLGLVVSVWRWYRPDGDMTLDQLNQHVRDAALRIVRA